MQLTSRKYDPMSRDEDVYTPYSTRKTQGMILFPKTRKLFTEKIHGWTNNNTGICVECSLVFDVKV